MSIAVGVQPRDPWKRFEMDNGSLNMLAGYSDDEEPGADLDEYVQLRSSKKAETSAQPRVPSKYESEPEESDNESSSESEPSQSETIVSSLVDYVDEDATGEGDDNGDALPAPTSALSDLISPPNSTTPQLEQPTPDLKLEEEPTRKQKRDYNLDELFSMLPPAKKSCPKKLREKVQKCLQRVDQGQSINAKLWKIKDMRNPYILEHLLIRHNLDELGSNYPSDRFNPHGYKESEYHDELQKAQCDFFRPNQGKKGIIEFTNGSRPETSSIPGTSEPGGADLPQRKSRWDVGSDADVGIPFGSQQQQVIYPVPVRPGSQLPIAHLMKRK